MSKSVHTSSETAAKKEYTSEAQRGGAGASSGVPERKKRGIKRIRLD